MKHNWEPYYDPAKSNAEIFISEPQRKCQNCGVIQTRITEHLWMRVTGYKWRPLAGRCKK